MVAADFALRNGDVSGWTVGRSEQRGRPTEVFGLLGIDGPRPPARNSITAVCRRRLIVIARAFRCGVQCIKRAVLKWIRTVEKDDFASTEASFFSSKYVVTERSGALKEMDRAGFAISKLRF